MARGAEFVESPCDYFEECGRGAWAKGMCLMHYKRVWRGGVAERPSRLAAGATLESALKYHGWVVTDAGCWEWQGPVANWGGYGVVYNKGQTLTASRVAYEVWKGVHPGELFVCHTCDNRICINPDHLWLGTNEDNMRDMRGKGRSGESRRVMTDEAVRSMREDRLNGETYAELSRKYGVSKLQVKNICDRKAWIHVE